MPHNHVKASAATGVKVKNMDRENLGEINDTVINEEILPSEN